MTPAELIVPALSDPGRWGAQAIDWAVHLASKTVFRVRGFSWLDRLGLTVVALSQQIPRMELARQQMAGWDLEPFDWNENFAAAQINRAKQGKTLRFDKAAKVLLLGEVSAREAGRPAGDVFRNMHLEAAAYYVLDFDHAMLTYAEGRAYGLMQAVANRTGQPRSVIQAMLRGEAVSYRLALLTHQVLSGISTELGDPRLAPGAVAVRWNRPASAEHEIIDGPSDPSPQEITQRLAAGHWI